jgi:hypothetical protein
MDEHLKSLAERAGKRRNLDNPPLHLWHPPLSGDIPIEIAADGRWYHDGGEIKRPALVRLFASLLRREENGEYYLVTPGEKWRISVERHPLLVTDFEVSGDDPPVISVTLNTGRRVVLDSKHPLYLDPEMEGIAAVTLDHGLSALFTRAAWYRLVDMAEERDGVPVVASDGIVYPLVLDPG